MSQPVDPTVAFQPEALPGDPGISFDARSGPRRPMAEVFETVLDPAAVTRAGAAPAPRAGQREAPQPEPGAPYHPRHVIGAGGGGEVWEALQVSLQRRVALKRLHDNPDGKRSAEVVEDIFRKEAYTTAALEHPNIVPVYDLGTDERGRPMLVMKLVQGAPWDRVLAEDFAALPPAELLAKHLPILAQVAQAVAFAHDRRVIHRDLKPGQVMLGRFGEVLLMDWGLAMSLGAEGEELASSPPASGLAPRLTEASSPAGTPAFMAPEQTLEHAHLIGTWTDVYLLGGILYWILTGGKAPHEAPTAYLAFKRAQAGDVTPPSERTPGRAIPAELESLAMRALEPEPARRVPDAEAFLASIQEYQTGSSRRREAARIIDAVARRADPPPRDYVALTELLNEVARARLLWPENPGAAALRERLLEAQARRALAGGDLLLASVTIEQLGPGTLRATLGRELGTATHSLRRRERERAALRLATVVLMALILGGGGWFIVRLDTERQLAEAQRDRAVIAERDAKEQRDAAVAARAEAESNLAIAQQQGEGAYGMVDFVLRDLKTAMDAELSVERGITVPVANEIAHAIAGRVVEPVLAYFESVPPSEIERWPEQLRLERASQMLDTGSRFAQLGRVAEGVRLTSPTLGIIEATLGPEHPETARSLSDLASLLDFAGDFSAALPLSRRALEIREKALGPDDPATAESLERLAILLQVDGAFDDAEAMLRRALAIKRDALGADSPLTATTMSHLASLVAKRGGFAEALELQRGALAIREAALGPDDPQTAQSLNNLAGLHETMGEYPEARALLERTIAIQEKELGPSHPELATSLNNLGNLTVLMGDYAAARQLHERALAINEKALGPNHPAVSTNLANLGSVLRNLGDFEGARPLLERAVAIDEAVYGPEHPSTATALNNLAALVSRMRDSAAARPLLERVLAINEKTLGPDHPNTARSLHNLATTLVDLGDFAAALPLYERSVAIFEETLGPEHPATSSALANLAGVHRRTGDYATAKPLLERALAISEKVNGAEHPETAKRLLDLGRMFRDAGDHEAARPIFQRAIAINEAALGADHPASRSARESSFRNLALLAAAQAAAPDPAANATAPATAQEATALFLDQLRDERAEDVSRALYAKCLLLLGRPEEARALAQSLADTGYPATATESERAAFLALCDELGLAPPPAEPAPGE
ncbi:MAG: serine/threonine-protein kinase [Candidatus Sumerlaeia bacterium]|nr:serine/threonine-protein kinase [Candidatus Sumerlaeia bacterium]